MGVAAYGYDLLDLAHAWRERLPEAEFIAPNAPFPYDYAPEGRQWFSLADRAPEKLLAGLREAGVILDRFFDELLARRGLALSGAAHLLGEIASKPPVLLVHGEEDNVVPFQSMANAKTALETAGVKVRAVARPGLGHAIDRPGIALAGDFLREVLASGRAAAGRPA